MMLKLQYFGHLMQRVSSLVKTLILGKMEERGREQQRMRCSDGITDSVGMSLLRRWEARTGKPGVPRCMASPRTWHAPEPGNSSRTCRHRLAPCGQGQLSACAQMHLCAWQLVKTPLTPQTQLAQSAGSLKVPWPCSSSFPSAEPLQPRSYRARLWATRCRKPPSTGGPFPVILIKRYCNWHLSQALPRLRLSLHQAYLSNLSITQYFI